MSVIFGIALGVICCLFCGLVIAGMVVALAWETVEAYLAKKFNERRKRYEKQMAKFQQKHKKGGNTK